jgi:hypothetical protein
LSSSSKLVLLPQELSIHLDSEHYFFSKSLKASQRTNPLKQTVVRVSNEVYVPQLVKILLEQTSSEIPAQSRSS